MILKRMMQMRYELYIDSLFLMNFGMNLYLLILVNRSTFHTARPWRILLGAVSGSIGFLLLFLGAVPFILRVLAGVAAGTVGMLLIAFPVRNMRMLLKLLERLLFYSFCMGGLLLFLIRIFPGFRGWLTGIWGILAVGGIAFLFMGRFSSEGEKGDYVCSATLRREGICVTVAALIDSGNSLTEPVSGKPVSVVEEGVFQELWKDSIQGFRAIPYHSIGKSRGIMAGYLLPELCLEIDGIKKEFRDVYIAVSDEEIRPARDAGKESVKMIINPMLLRNCPG